MAVFKNQIPILEFDTEQSAVIMPGHHSDYHFPRKAVMLFMEPEIDDFVAQNECEVVGKFINVTKVFWVYKTKINSVDIAFVQAPLGGAGAVKIMEQLIAGGVKEIIAADSLADVDAHDIRNWGNDFFAAAMKIAYGSNNRGVDMRSENEMYNLILEVAKNDVRVKAVYMNGSRTNP